MGDLDAAPLREQRRPEPHEERNGFTLPDFDREAVRVVTWHCPEGYVAPASLAVEPAVALALSRRG